MRLLISEVPLHPYPKNYPKLEVVPGAEVGSSERLEEPRGVIRHPPLQGSGFRVYGSGEFEFCSDGRGPRGYALTVPETLPETSGSRGGARRHPPPPPAGFRV